MCSAISDGCAASGDEVISGEGGVDLVLPVLWGLKGGRILANVASAGVGGNRQAIRHAIGALGRARIGDKGIGDALPYGRDISAGAGCDKVDAAPDVSYNVSL